jgi:rod shape-determining protein MreB
MLGRDVVFGKDIVEHRLALNIIRPFEKGILKYNQCDLVVGGGQDGQKRAQAARLLVEHAVSLMRPPKGTQVYGVIGAPSRATIVNKRVVLEAARTSLDGVMVVSEPFAIAYGMNRLSDTLVVDIGAGTIDLCPIYGTVPAEEDQVTVALGGDFIDEHFMNLMGKVYPEARLSMNMAREIKEKYGFVHDVNEKAIVTLPVEGKLKPFDVTAPLKEACRMIVTPILEALRGLVARLDPEFQHRLLGNIVLGGGGSQLKGLDRLIEEGLKEYGSAKVTKVGDAIYAGAIGALKLAMNLPAECWSKLRGAPQDAPVRNAA